MRAAPRADLLAKCGCKFVAHHGLLLKNADLIWHVDRVKRSPICTTTDHHLSSSSFSVTDVFIDDWNRSA
jgi:hypothetical protein